ncbi:hypothetical protein [Pseudomonas kurunegalensis]|uniref:hypothetical protein n=1 Tax=Pseudomonas kurunegalensis TaxID=485880 RepID=UPI0025701E00|nr:hypothetical protein [Pseudomonas kurunegalensis]WJD60902.1 hypothetical protein QQ992_18405 [Pseudomonas kurunegalensis]
MQLNISRGAKATGKTIRLRQTAKKAGIKEKNILIGTNYVDQELEQKVLQLALRGLKVICIDECREEQLAFLRRVKHRICNSVTVHVVVAN